MNRQILKYIVFIGLFIIPFVPFFVSGSLFFPFITTKAYAFRIIVEIVFAAWLLLALFDPAYRPRKSWTTYALLAFLVVIGIADLFGAAPVKSFWSNSERMEGYILLLHLGMLYFVIRSTFNQVEWKRWWNTSLAASALMAGYSFFQLLGVFEIHQGGARVDGTLGNAAYLAVYMLFHIFITLIFFARERRRGPRVVYGALAVVDLVVLYYTATRGAILGLIGGLIVAALLSIWKSSHKMVRRLAIAYLVGLAVLVLGFFAVKNTSFVQSSPVLSRFASISSAELKTEGRSFVWPIALRGIEEHPVLGWGQDNFNYIFNEHYEPQMYKIEPWFDRAHNIFLDWATQGGILGLFAYLSLYGVLLYYVWRKESDLTVTDRSLITGLVVAYFFHNFFVFDNLVSYTLFIALLAYVDSQSKTEVVGESMTLDRETVQNIGTPVILVGLLFMLYFVNIRPIMANTSLIDALRAVQSGNATAAVQSFEYAYGEARLGRPEIVEQIATNIPQILSSNLSTDDKNAFYSFARSAVEAQVAELPTDARYQLLAGTFLDNTGHFDEAIEHLKKASELTPGKQLVYYQLATAYMSKGDNAQGLATLKAAYELDTANTDAEMAYLIGAIYAGDRGLEQELKADLAAHHPEVLLDDRIGDAYVTANRFGDAVAFYRAKLAADSHNVQMYVNLAAVYLKVGDKTNAIATLHALGDTLPQYKETANNYITQINNGTIR